MDFFWVIIEQFNEQFELGEALNYLGDIYFNKGEFQEALNIYNKAKKIIEEINNFRIMAMVYHNIASTHEILDEIDEALDFLEAALKLIGGRAVINSINLENGEERADQICQLAKQYGAAYRKVENASGKGYLIDHSSNTYVIAADGTLNTILPDATSPQKIIGVIRSLLSQGKNINSR